MKRLLLLIAKLFFLFGIQNSVYADIEPSICDRTQKVENAIVAAVQANDSSVNSCSDVTESHLYWADQISVRNIGLTSLKARDFAGLPRVIGLDLGYNDLTTIGTNVFDGMAKFETLSLMYNELTSVHEDAFKGIRKLKRIVLSSNKLTSVHEDLFDGLELLLVLALDHNNLTSVPEDLLDGLSSLKFVSLQGNNLKSIPENLFDGRSKIEMIWLFDNPISSLHEDLFDGLTSLELIDLHYLDLTELPADLFDGLSSLEIIRLQNNELTSLPDGIFEGLTELEELNLSWNPSTLNVNVSLERVGDDEFKAKVHTGAPFDIVLPISVTNGTIEGSATTITVPRGSVESDTLSVTRTEGSTDAVTVTIGSTLPSLPEDHSGYQLVTSSATVSLLVDIPNRAPTGAPTISGTAQVGETLTASITGITDEDGLDDAEFDYQWIRYNGTSDVDIDNATSATYTPVEADVAATIKVRVTFTDDRDTEETLTSSATSSVIAQSALSVADAEAN